MDLNSQKTEEPQTISPQKWPQLLHDLHLHQLELEVQNLELRKAWEKTPAERSGTDGLYDAAPIGYLDLDDQGGIRNINSAAAAILQSTASGLLGLRLINLISMPDRKAFQENLEAVFSEGGKLREEFRLNLSGEERIVQLLSLPCPPAGSGRQLCRLAMTDITKTKRAEAEILRLAAFPQFNPNPIMELAADGTLTYFNEAADALANRLREQSPASLLPPETQAIVRECLATRQSRLHHETTLGGRSLCWSFIPVATSNVVHCYAVDRTEHARMEEQKLHASKMESVGYLSAGLAHDFNNILTVIQGYSSLLLALERLPMEMTEPLRMIASASERAAGLTRQLLSFGRKKILSPVTLDLNETIEGVAARMRRALGDEIALQFAFSPGLPGMKGDPEMIEQIILNLILNSGDAINGRGQIVVGTSHLQTDDAHVKEHPQGRAGRFLCLTVRDNGKGIDPAALPRIFEPFYTTKGGAPGLGLTTVYNLARQHDGWVEVENEPEKGCTFRVYFPALPKSAEPVKSKSKTAGGHETIFVVEDDPTLRELVARQLRQLGYAVVEARSGVDALSVWPKYADTVDLLFTDMVMPDGMTGRDLAETLRSQRPDLRVIYTSGYSADLIEQDFALKKGFSFLQKPYAPNALANIVRQSLDVKSEGIATH